jgi:hypothetical protein
MQLIHDIDVFSETVSADFFCINIQRDLAQNLNNTDDYLTFFDSLIIIARRFWQLDANERQTFDN